MSKKKNKKLLIVRELCTYYYHPNIRGYIIRALDGVSFELNFGENLAIIGESGSGKSTLAHSIIRILPSNGRIVRGDVIFKGINLTGCSEHELRKIYFKDISIVFQSAMNILNPVTKIEDQIADVIMLHNKLSKKDSIKKARELLESVGIPSDKSRCYPHQLSGGQKQRVCIAMAIALNPSLTIFDEPFSALDVMVQAQLIDLLHKIQKKIISSMMIITHDIYTTRLLCEKTAIMYAGKFVEYADTNKIFESAAHPYSQSLIEAAPALDEPIAKIKYVNGSPPSLVNPPSGCRFHPRCPYASDICIREEPLLIKINNGHYVACHLWK